MLNSAVLVLAATVLGQTENPQKEWLQFLKGDWTYEYKALEANGKPVKGDVKYTLAAKRQVVIARGKEESDEWVELIGWQPDKKQMLFVGYGSLHNNYWVAEYSQLAKDKLSGEVSGVLPDGRIAKGKTTLLRVDDDHFEVHLDLTADGEKLVDVGKFSRKKE